MERNIIEALLTWLNRKPLSCSTLHYQNEVEVARRLAALLGFDFVLGSDLNYTIVELQRCSR